jgi:hypothetical protein
MSAFGVVCRTARHLALGSILTALVSTTAFAQLSRATGSVPALAPGGIMRGTDTAYDPAHDVFLLVGGNGPIYGIFVNAAGQPVSTGFTIMDGSLGWGHFPRAEYSPHVSNGAGGQGGFLVTWHHNVGAPNYVFGRVVSFDAPGRLVSGIQMISDGEQGGSWWETGAAMAYSPTSRRFLVAWRTVGYGIRGRFVDTAGTPIGVAMQFENAGGSRDPALAWNPATDEFGLVSTGFGGTSAYAAFRRVRASDGFVFGRTSFGFAAGTFATGIDVNAANQYVVAWALHPGVVSAIFDQNGTELSTSFVTGRFGFDQSLALAYNRNSGTFLTAGSAADSFEIAAAELNSGGQPTTGAQLITEGARGASEFPMISARTGTNQWHVAYARDKLAAVSQFVATSSTGGGTPFVPTLPPGAGPTPTPTPGPTLGCTTADPFASIGGGTCVNGGWIPGKTGGTPTPAPGGCTTAAPASGWTCVNGGWVPPAAGGTGGTGGCTTPDPFAALGGGTCVGGGWVPGRAGGGTGGCTTVAPAAGWTCVNGGWLPPASGGTGCTTAAPASGWTCVNGGWLPPAAGGTGANGSCATADPFAAMGGGTCVNGGWTPGRAPGASSCPTAQPGAGWTCVNGGWLPPGTGPVASSCTTADPFASLGGGVCVNGGWTPANSSCTTPDPFKSLGGGVCSNGGWKPR